MFHTKILIRYITTQFIGGYMASKIGGTLLFGLGIGCTAILTLLTPIAAKYSFWMLLAVRIIEGVFEGVSSCRCFRIKIVI